MEQGPTLDPERVQEAFAEASALPTLSLPAFFANLREENAALADEVASLLAYNTPESAHGGRDATVSLPVTLLGKVVGGCRIEKLIGYGGMSAVYAATQDFPRRRVAVKIVQRERLSASARRRLRVEAEALARLQHPHIARVYSAGSQHLAERDEQEPSPYIVMELVEGAMPINAWANERGLDARARIELVAQIADAVEHAHRAGVIHRDIKPGNVIVGSDGVPKVIDFGIASVHDSNITAVTEGPMGTLAYMSPEQARGHSVDARSDVWGLGALLYDLLAGAPPFESTAKSIAAHIDRLLHDTAAPIEPLARATRGNEFAQTLPPASDAVLRKALANDPERRYRGAAEFAEELRHLVASEPLLARPESEWDSLARIMRRHRATLVTVAGIVLALTAGLIVSLSLLSRERDAHHRAQWANYVASIAAASSMLERGDASAAHDMLESAPHEHRGWEWKALRQLSSQSKWSVQFTYGEQVYDTDWSLDGKRIIAAAGGDLVAIDRATQRELWRVHTPTKEGFWRVCAMSDGHVIGRMLGVDLMRVAPDGSVVASGTNHTLTDLATDAARTRLFANDLLGAQEIDPITLATIRSIEVTPPVRSYPRAIAAAADASFLVLGCDDGTVMAITTTSGATRWEIKPPTTNDHTRSVALSRDGRFAAAANRSGIVLINATNGAVLWRTDGSARDYRDCTFSADSSEVIGSSWNESVDRYDTRGGALIGAIVGAHSQVWNSAVSPDGREIASGSFAARVDVFDARATSRIDEFALDGSAVNSVATHKGRTFATTADGGLFTLDVSTSDEVLQLASSLHSNAVCTLPSGELAVAHDGGISWINADGGTRASISLPTRAISVGTLDQGATTTVHTEDEQVHAFATDTGAALWSVDGFKAGSTTAIETTAAHTVFLPRGLRGAQAFYDTTTAKEKSIPTPSEYSTCGAISPDRTLVALGSLARAAEVTLIDSRTFASVARLPNHRGAVRAVAWSPDSSRIASASADGTVRVWHVANGVELLTAWRGSCNALAWDDRSTLWLACEDGVLRAMRVRE